MENNQAVAAISPGCAQEGAEENPKPHTKFYMILIFTPPKKTRLLRKCVCACVRCRPAAVIDVQRSVVCSDMRLAFLKSVWQTLLIVPCV